MTREYKELELPDGDWFMYVLECEHRYHYVGVTTNLEHRLREHQNGRGALVTKQHKPMKLQAVYSLGYMSYKEAEEYEDCYTLTMVIKSRSKRWRGGRFCAGCDTSKAKKILASRDGKYKQPLEEVEFSFDFGIKPKKHRKYPKRNPWAKQERKARGALKRSARNRFGFI